MIERRHLPRWLAIALQVGVTVAVAAFIVSRVDFREVGALLAGVRLPLLAVSFAILAARVPLAACRWRLFLDRYGHHFSTAHLTRMIFASQFFATVLPGASALDVVRGYYLYRRNVTARHVVATVLAERVAGVLSLVMLALVPAVWFAWQRPDLWPPLSTVTVVMVVVGVVVYQVNRRPLSLVRSPRALQWVWTRLAPLARELSVVMADRPLLLRVLALSLVFQIAGLVSVFAAGRAVGAEVGFFYYLVFVPLVWLWTTLPISLNGIGIREGAFVFYFGLVGMPPETALAISLLVSLQAVVVGLGGGLVLPFARGLRTPASPAR